MANSKAYGKVVKARTVLLITQPFFGCLALHLNLVEVKDGGWCDTMAVDGHNMYFCPSFVEKLTERQLMGVVAHEVMHCVYKHFSRRGSRHPIIWNYAGDYIINADLKKASIELPDPHLFDKKYDNMSTEEVYERIHQEVSKKIAKGGLGQDPGGCGGVMDAGSGPGEKGDKASREWNAGVIDREWEANVRMAVNVARGSNAGKLPGFLQRVVGQLEKPKKDWREETRQFIDGNMTKDYSWSRPNRRYASSGLILPGFTSDCLHHLVMIFDTSGSVSERLLTAMVSEGAGALDGGVADRLTCVYADTRVHNVDEYEQGDLVKPTLGGGGGGTCFNDSFQWVKKNASDASCVVYLTDMMTGSFGEEPECPVLWAAYLPEQHLAGIKPPFGHIVHVDGAAF